MEKTIKLIKNNNDKDWTDLEWVTEFYEFLQGNNPETINTNKMNLSKDDAFTIIWYLQEHLSILPDNIEKCDECQGLYDCHSEGYYSEERLKTFCDCSSSEEWQIDNPEEE